MHVKESDSAHSRIAGRVRAGLGRGDASGAAYGRALGNRSEVSASASQGDYLRNRRSPNSKDSGKASYARTYRK